MSGPGLPGRRAVARPAVLLASAAFHAAVLVLLLRHLSQTPVYAESPILQVSLVPPPPRADRTSPRRSQREPSRIAPVFRIAPPARDAAPAPAASPAAAADDGLPVNGRQALRSLRGCDAAGLTREERERCETRRWTRAGPAMARLNLDPSGGFAEDPEPFLSRRPRKGCRVRATGDVDAMGDSGGARAGLTCAMPF